MLEQLMPDRRNREAVPVGRALLESKLRSHAFTQPALACCFQNIFTRSDESI
jgi:hypothetical protein